MSLILCIQPNGVSLLFMTPEQRTEERITALETKVW